MERYFEFTQRSSQWFSNYIYQKIFDLSVEWGDHWGNMVNERIKRLYPELSDRAIESLNYECKEIQQYRIRLSTNGQISKNELIERIHTRYPRLSQENIEKLINAKIKEINYKNYNNNVSNSSHVLSYLRPTVAFIKKILPGSHLKNKHDGKNWKNKQFNKKNNF